MAKINLREIKKRLASRECRSDEERMGDGRAKAAIGEILGFPVIKQLVDACARMNSDAVIALEILHHLSLPEADAYAWGKFAKAKNYLERRGYLYALSSPPCMEVMVKLEGLVQDNDPFVCNIAASIAYDAVSRRQLNDKGQKRLLEMMKRSSNSTVRAIASQIEGELGIPCRSAAASKKRKGSLSSTEQLIRDYDFNPEGAKQILRNSTHRQIIATLEELLKRDLEQASLASCILTDLTRLDVRFHQAVLKSPLIHLLSRMLLHPRHAKRAFVPDCFRRLGYFEPTLFDRAFAKFCLSDPLILNSMLDWVRGHDEIRFVDGLQDLQRSKNFLMRWACVDVLESFHLCTDPVGRSLLNKLALDRNRHVRNQARSVRLRQRNKKETSNANSVVKLGELIDPVPEPLRSITFQDLKIAFSNSPEILRSGDYDVTDLRDFVSSWKRLFGTELV